MKRLIALLLAITCVFALASCGDSTNDLQKVVLASKPDVIKTLTTVITGEEVFHGTYLTTINGEDFTFEYSYEQYADISEAADSYIKTVEGVVYYKDGKYSEDGENWSVENPGVDDKSVKLNLDSENFTEYTLNTDQTSLVATFTSENSEIILGRKIVATGEILLSVSTNGQNLTLVSISYATENGEVRIDTSYTYTLKGDVAADDGDEGEE
jgi:uncharacterized lipoprotein YehR (DUF1307 family)